jgi:hypothetical protein
MKVKHSLLNHRQLFLSGIVVLGRRLSATPLCVQMVKNFIFTIMFFLAPILIVFGCITLFFDDERLIIDTIKMGKN